MKHGTQPVPGEGALVDSETSDRMRKLALRSLHEERHRLLSIGGGEDERYLRRVERRIDALELQEYRRQQTLPCPVCGVVGHDPYDHGIAEKLSGINNGSGEQK